MNFDHLIKNWHAKASDEDYFSKFVFEYLAFIAFLKKKRFADAESDRSAIQQLKQGNSTKLQYLQKVTGEQEIRDAWNNIKVELDSAPLGNISGSGDRVEEIKWWNCSLDADRFNQQTESELKKPKGVIHNLNDWENMVEFWYSIRNNLFHGAKNPQDRRDQLLVENGYKALRPLVEIFLSEERKQ